MKILVYLILGLFCIGLVSAIINNPNLPQITRKPQITSSVSNNNTLNVNNSNCWQSDCGGFRSQVNQGVNTTSNVQFRNLTVQNFTVTGFATGNFSKVNDVNTTRCWWDLCHPSAFDSMFLPLSGGGTVTGDIITIGTYYSWTEEGRKYFIGSDMLADTFQIVNDAGRTLIQSLNDEDFAISNDDESVEDKWLDNGIKQFLSAKGYEFYKNNILILNLTNDTSILRSNLNVSGKIVSGNITSPHQTYNFNGSVVLNTQYNNTLDRPIIVSVTGVSTVALLNDIAFFTMKNGGSIPNEAQAYGCIKQITGSIGVAVYCQLTMTVPPGFVWTVNSTVGGSGTTTIEIAKVTVL